jgi:hypothetical protein
MIFLYRTFRELNLHLRKYLLPKGTYYLYVPLRRKISLAAHQGKLQRNNPILRKSGQGIVPLDQN